MNGEYLLAQEVGTQSPYLMARQEVAVNDDLP